MDWDAFPNTPLEESAAIVYSDFYQFAGELLKGAKELDKKLKLEGPPKPENIDLRK